MKVSGVSVQVSGFADLNLLTLGTSYETTLFIIKM
jgi:hypothetical protein